MSITGLVGFGPSHLSVRSCSKHQPKAVHLPQIPVPKTSQQREDEAAQTGSFTTIKAPHLPSRSQKLNFSPAAFPPFDPQPRLKLLGQKNPNPAQPRARGRDSLEEVRAGDVRQVERDALQLAGDVLLAGAESRMNPLAPLRPHLSRIPLALKPEGEEPQVPMRLSPCGLFGSRAPAARAASRPAGTGRKTSPGT